MFSKKDTTYKPTVIICSREGVENDKERANNISDDDAYCPSASRFFLHSTMLYLQIMACHQVKPSGIRALPVK